MRQQSETQHLVPSIQSAIEQVGRQLGDHRRHIHVPDAFDDLVGCTGCGALKHRLSVLMQYRDLERTYAPAHGIRFEKPVPASLGPRSPEHALSSQVEQLLAGFRLPKSRDAG